ncbi:glycosyltransferase family 2 protein [Kyrpidia spormannii]|uniref:glycosyltransferase family 2 protein n=1 Tax=Kyrpidia spormannii TaxID=2055160 RepID=UPI00130002D1|nr:glycosyltransferase [Kyrpidia spormannii]
MSAVGAGTGSPLISVVVPVYNHERYIFECVDSALMQEGAPPFEVVVVDDGSTDRTPRILQTFGPRIQVIRQPRSGAATALNRGFAAARAPYVCWLSSDDRFEPGKLAAQWQYVTRRPCTALCYTSFHVIDGHGVRQYTVDSPWDSDRNRLYATLLEGCFINGSTTIVRKDAFFQVGGFDPALVQGHDYDLWLRLFERYEVGCIPEPLLSYRWHGSNMSANPAADRYYSNLVRQRAARRRQQFGGGTS